MNRDDYVTTLVVGDKIVPVGLDDAGQTYYFEYVDSKGNITEGCCGAYNSQYVEYIEYMLGDPEEDCPHYQKMADKEDLMEDCPNKFSYGYCDKCFYQDIKWANFQTLIDLGIIDRRGNVKEKYSSYLMKKEEIDDNV